MDFKPFTTTFISQTSFNGDMVYGKRARTGVTETITNIFTPEDIELTERLYCLWIAE